MDLQLQNELVLITASSGGIGRAIAKALADEGCNVIISGRSRHSVDSAAEKLKAISPEVKVERLVADNGTAEGCKTTIKTFPQVDLVINNLGIYEAVGFFEKSDQAWEHLFAPKGILISYFPTSQKNGPTDQKAEPIISTCPGEAGRAG